MLSFAGDAQATTITFGEVPLVNGQLVTTQFAAFGIDLSDAIIFNEASTSGGIGISPANSATSATIVFDDVISSLTIEYVAVGGYEIGISLFGAANEFLAAIQRAMSRRPPRSSISRQSGSRACNCPASRGRSAFRRSIAVAGNPVPEPATWAMMIGGFGLAGGAMRYRRRMSATQARRVVGTSANSDGIPLERLSA